MDFGLFYYCQGRGVPHDQAYGEMLDQIALAETLGFGECWFAEHHFTDYSLLPSPNLMIAAALQRTTRMRFGNYVNVLPFHHPLRLAAEARHARQSRARTVRLRHRQGRPARRVRQARPQLRRGVRDDRRGHRDPSEALARGHRLARRPLLEVPGAEPAPARVSAPPPAAPHGREPARLGRARGRAWLAGRHALHADRRGRALRGGVPCGGRRAARGPGDGPYRPRLLLCRETYVAETPAAARAEGALALQGFWYLSSLAAPPLPGAYSDARFKELTGRVWGGRTYDELDAVGGMLIGTPDQVADKVAGLEAIGVDTVLLVCSFGNLSHAQVCRSLELFAEAAIRPRLAAARPPEASIRLRRSG